MTRLGLRPWTSREAPATRSVPVSVVILSKNEEASIGRCLASVAWAAQVIVVDSGSADRTVAIAREHGAQVVEQPWLGFAAQREFALRHPAVRHDWVYFVDADEWISAPTAAEVAAVMRTPAGAAYAQRLRLVFQGRWIRHCGWYSGSWVVRLLDRRHASFGGGLVGERAVVNGPVLRLRHDLVDEDRKGLAAWLHKHVDYAALEARQRGRPLPLGQRLRAMRSRTDSRPVARAILKDLIFPAVPVKPAAMFTYMYVLRLGVLDGRAGLRFCFYHAWYEACVGAMRAPQPATRAARPCLGVLDFHPIQYHAPLYQALAERARIDVDVLFLNQRGHQSAVDPGFGVPVAWNINLLSGYPSRFLRPSPPGSRLLALVRWIRARDVVVVHGHSDPWMLTAALACRATRTPYLLRGDAGPDSQATGARRALRSGLAWLVVSRSAGGLAVGQRNEAFYRKYRAPRVTFAPHSVDNRRFAREPARPRRELLGRLSLPADRPVILFCGKLQPYKRPLDVLAAVRRLGQDVTVLFVGDGALADEVRTGLEHGRGAVTGFVNQAELPAYYHCGDILVLPSEAEPWGLVVNEAMAAGALPVVSSGVGCAADLVAGTGEIYPTGDTAALAAALSRALARLGDPGLAKRLQERIELYGVEQTALGFEQATDAAWRG
jgi:glycosyltransferase involved in cell wall biosynthesis